MSFRQEVVVRTWKIVIAFIALSAASILALGHNRSNTLTGNTTGLAAKHTASQQSTPARAPDGAKSESEYGWGPFRTTDW